MTPIDVLEDLRDFLAKKIKERNELAEADKNIRCFMGFLPKAITPQTKEALCPAVVVGYAGVIDRADESVVSVVISAITRDEDMIHGANELFHLLEFIRFCLLSANPVCDKYDVKGGTMETSVPDEQPYPQWWGRIDFEVYIPQPTRPNHFLVGGPHYGRNN
ncbi:hypothetical protein [Megasphaera elsdenii]|uniref:hypothetical protein n=1 Tax=Megasphaera elsdenii TaxID=907 RepID=UPI003392A44E